MEISEMTEEVHIVRSNSMSSTVRKRAREILENIKRGNKVCRLNRALYGLEQSGRQWHRRLDQELRGSGFTPLSSDPYVYSSNRGKVPILIIVYIDDILIISRNEKNIIKIGETLSKAFKIRDLGDVSCCLGIEFVNHNDGFSIHQDFIQDVLARFEMSECKPASTSMSVGSKLSRNTPSNDKEDKNVLYRELVRSLMYKGCSNKT